MGLFDLFKKKENNAPIMSNEIQKKYDYFAFSVKSELPRMKLVENPKNVVVKFENESLNVYYNGSLIGSGNNQAVNKYKEHCTGKWNVHSFVVYDEGRAKTRIKYYY